jgi:gamma-glutamyltranspeptidase/glutathione hydrolase
MVTSNHPVASAAGVEILARGGNAVDAAVATMFALSVVEPMMTTIFGAGFTVIRAPDGVCTTIDNYAVVPRRATPDMYEAVHESSDDPAGDHAVAGRRNVVGHQAVAVGGTLLGWATVVEQYGRLALREVVEPAARLAAGGFRASPYLRAIISMSRPDLERYPSTADVFLPGGSVPDRVIRTDYANTLRLVGEHGPDYLYRGPLGSRIVEDMAANGGLITAEDLETYRVYERPPVRGSYRGHEIVSMAPPSSGGTHLIQILNILEGFTPPGFGTPESVHLLAEAMKIAFADRAKWMADPSTIDVPVDWLTSKEYASRRSAQVDRGRAQAFEPTALPDRESASTTHCCAMDAEGWVAASTNTLHHAFGSKVTVPGTGVLLNNCMQLMDPVPGRPNSIAPGKRILSSMTPTIVLRDGEPFLTLGTPGGIRIFGSVLQAIVNVIDHRMPIQEAFEAPRMWDRGPMLELERGFADLHGLRAALEARGHRVSTPFKIAGGMNGIVRDPDSGLMWGAACWRADGAACGWSGGDGLVATQDATAPMWS